MKPQCKYSSFDNFNNLTSFKCMDLALKLDISRVFHQFNKY